MFSHFIRFNRVNNKFGGFANITRSHAITTHFDGEKMFALKSNHKVVPNQFSYKVFTPLEFSAFNNTGYFYGNARDSQKGYICMCGNTEQIKKVIIKHYNNNIVFICKFSNTKMPYLKYEQGSDGDIYPHLYQTLYSESVVKTIELTTDVNNYKYYYEGLNELDKHL